MNCTRCRGTGFLNTEQIEDGVDIGDKDAVFAWMKEHPESDVTVCDCCGNGENWYGEPGEHYGSNDPVGSNGPYAYNGGLCECH